MISLGKVVTDIDSVEMYAEAFTKFFKLCSEASGKPIRFYHLHGDGIMGVTIDMDNKQLQGWLYPTGSR